jgi:hypothetical protein
MTLVEKGGQALDGTAFREKTLNTYLVLMVGEKYQRITVKQVRAKKDGQESLIITLKDFPVLQLRCSAPAADGSFWLQGFYFLGGSPSGWNEFTLDMSGTGVFTVYENMSILEIKTPLEPIQISSGKILHNGSRFTGEQALTMLRNRYERLLALTQWMHTQEGVPDFDTQEAFEAYWKPLLLPELVSEKKRPAAFKQEPAEWVRAEDISWNTSYTEALLPEELRVLRNSGALIRDWEEAGAWIYIQYQWDYLMEQLSTPYILRLKT